MRLLCILAVLVASTGTALAGECDDATGEQVLQTIEKYAKDPKAKPAEVWGLCMDQVVAVQPKRAQRFLAACEKILEIDRTYGVCVKWPIVMGKKQLGKIELIDLVEEAFKMEPLVWDSEPALLYLKLDDPRAMPRLIAGWKAQLAAKKPPRAGVGAVPRRRREVSWQARRCDREDVPRGAAGCRSRARHRQVDPRGDHRDRPASRCPRQTLILSNNMKLTSTKDIDPKRMTAG